MILSKQKSCFHCDKEEPHRTRTTRTVDHEIRCGRCNSVIGPVEDLEVIRDAAHLIDLLCTRNCFEIEEFGVREPSSFAEIEDLGARAQTAFVELRSRAHRARILIDWRFLTRDEYNVAAEDGSLAGKVARLKVPFDQAKVDALPDLLKSAVRTIVASGVNGAVPIQSSITDERGQIRFRALCGMDNNRFGLMRIQMNWAAPGLGLHLNDDDSHLLGVKAAS